MKNSKEPRKGLDAALDELPLFPLGQVVLFPRAVLPLHVFEPRYRTMLRDCVETHGAMAVVLIKAGGEVDAQGNPFLSEVAGAGIVMEHQEHPDGRWNILIHGSARVRLEELPFVPPYRRARATILRDTDTPVATSDRTALVAAASAFAGEVYRRDANFSFRLPPNAETNTLADLCAHHLVVDAAARQAILEELDVSMRTQMVIRELAIQQRAFMKDNGGVLH